MNPGLEPWLIVARAAHFAGTVSLCGTLAFWCLIARPAFHAADGPAAAESRLRRHLIRLAWWSLLLAAVSGVAWLLAVAAQMSGEPLGRAISGGVIGTVLTRTRFGQDWLLRLVLALLLGGSLGVLGHSRRSEWGWIGQALGAALLATLAWSGHGGATPGALGNVHLAADILHLLAAGAWLGALLPLGMLLAEARRQGDAAMTAVARTAALRFSILGVAGVGTLLVTGIANTWFLVGTLPALIDTVYGRLLLLKVALFAVMVGIAAINRLRLTQRIDGRRGPAGRDAVAQLQRNALAEATLGLLVLAVVAVLGTLPPAKHHHPGHPGHGDMSTMSLRVHHGFAPD